MCIASNLSQKFYRGMAIFIIATLLAPVYEFQRAASNIITLELSDTNLRGKSAVEKGTTIIANYGQRQVGGIEGGVPCWDRGKRRVDDQDDENKDAAAATDNDEIIASPPAKAKHVRNNQLFETFLNEFYTNERHNNNNKSEIQDLLKDAMEAVKNCSVDLENGSDLGRCLGFGAKLCNLLDKKLHVHNVMGKIKTASFDARNARNKREEKKKDVIDHLFLDIIIMYTRANTLESTGWETCNTLTLSILFNFIFHPILLNFLL